MPFKKRFCLSDAELAPLYPQARMSEDFAFNSSGKLQTEPEDALSMPVDFKSRMAAPDVASADPMGSRPAVSEQGYTLAHMHPPSMSFVRQDGQDFDVSRAHISSNQHQQQSGRLPRQHSSIAEMLSASSYNLVTSARQNDSEHVVMPMTDSGEVDRLAVLCHCAYASQFSENPEDIFKFACIDAKINQSEDTVRDSCTPETQGPFPQATLVCTQGTWMFFMTVSCGTAQCSNKIMRARCWLPICPTQPSFCAMLLQLVHSVLTIMVVY